MSKFKEWFNKIDNGDTVFPHDYSRDLWLACCRESAKMACPDCENGGPPKHKDNYGRPFHFVGDEDLCCAENIYNEIESVEKGE